MHVLVKSMDVYILICNVNEHGLAKLINPVKTD